MAAANPNWKFAAIYHAFGLGPSCDFCHHKFISKFLMLYMKNRLRFRDADFKNNR
jgi:hypothetical protein